MPHATCRCGQVLAVPASDVGERIVCPRCGARVRLRVRAPGDGFLRFLCPCGQRLKVNAEHPPSHGQCPECGRVVPVPKDQVSKKPMGHPETPTTELSLSDRTVLEEWGRQHSARTANNHAGTEPTPPIAAPAVSNVPTPARAEAGLRICPKCRKPIHLGAETCRSCGTPVPKR